MTETAVPNAAEMSLGKQEYEHDERTLMLANFIKVDIKEPPTYDFDKKRKSIPVSMLGNDQWGNCVKVAQTNGLIRLERLEQRRTLPIKTPHVVDEYKEECKRQNGVAPKSGGDQYDNGLVMLKNFKNWRKVGWPLDFRKAAGVERTYTIAAYGELQPLEQRQLRQAIYLFHGIHMGFWLPRTAQEQTAKGYWDVVDGPGNEPGSWGGHAVFSKRYDRGKLYVLTWGAEIQVSNAFVAKYCDEAWAVVDNINHWQHAAMYFDVDGLVRKLHEIGAKVG
jgi:hypothetical protein